MPISEQEFLDAYLSSKTNKEALNKLGFKDERSLTKRVARIEKKLGKPLKPHRMNVYLPEHTHHEINDFEGVVAVFSDAHFWPGELSNSYSILLQILKDIKPDYIISNGDEFDGASISRYPRQSWENVPTVAQELKACSEAMENISKASETSKTLMCVGNHTARIEKHIIQNIPEFEGVEGFSLDSYFKNWNKFISVMFNGHFIVKHNYHGGIHAAWNNVLKSGVSIMTGHTHRLLTRPFTDYKGTRYGIECGTLCNIYGKQFNYANNNPRDWQEGFVVITVEDKRIHPELVFVNEGKALFRGKKYYA